jgi:hypothetical protein
MEQVVRAGRQVRLSVHLVRAGHPVHPEVQGLWAVPGLQDHMVPREVLVRQIQQRERLEVPVQVEPLVVLDQRELQALQVRLAVPVLMELLVLRGHPLQGGRLLMQHRLVIPEQHNTL